MNIEDLEQILEKEPKYRADQVRQAIYINLASNWDEITVLSKDLRARLNKEAPLDIKVEVSESKKGNSSKVLITFQDDQSIETVLMKHSDGRRTVCVSSQVGCPLGCSFCATGLLGFKRNLTTSEIVEQVLYWARELKKYGERVSNVVFMGMGEPFLNYDNVLAAIRILNAGDGLNIGARRISISTAGLIAEIRKLAKEDIQVNLAISLHAPNDALRTKLMPVNAKVSIRRLLKTVDDYIASTNRKVMFEYLLINGENDTNRHAEQLARLMDKPLYMVNLIPFNPTQKYTASSNRTIDRFKEILESFNIEVSQRHSYGGDIKAACGQLAGKK